MVYKPGDDMGVWWLINQYSDEDIIVRESRDKKHLVAASWPGNVDFLVYNSNIPCIHCGPSIQFTIDAKRVIRNHLPYAKRSNATLKRVNGSKKKRNGIFLL